MTVNELVARFLSHVAKRGTYSTAESLAERKRTLERFCARYGEREVASLVPADLTDWIEDQPAWRSSSTCKAKFNIVQRVFNWAAGERRIQCNPLRGAETFKDAKRRPCLDDDTLNRLCAATDVCFAKALRFLRLAGCRLSDMAKLTWPMILWDQGVAVVEVHKTNSTTGKAKLIPLTNEAIAMLAELRQFDQSDGFIFKNARGRPWNRRAIGSRLRRLKKRLGITVPGSTHGLRHQWGTVAYRNSGDIKLVSLGLGHASVAITEKFYVHVEGDIGLLRRAAEMANKKP